MVQNNFCAYDHKSWVMTERVRSYVQASEMRFLRRIEKVALFDKNLCSEIRKSSINIEPLLFGIERSQRSWCGHICRMPQERLLKQTVVATANGKRPVERPRWTNYIEALGTIPKRKERGRMMEDREVWRVNLELLPRKPLRKAGNENRVIVITCLVTNLPWPEDSEGTFQSSSRLYPVPLHC